MYIQFDKNRLHLQVICGTLEDYKPSEEIKVLQDKLNKIKEKTQEFQQKILVPSLEEIEKEVEELNTKQQEKTQEQQD